LEEYREIKSAKIQKHESAGFLEENNHLITDLDKSISKQQFITEASKIDWKNEADGTGGSGSAGIDKIALMKEGIHKSDAAKLTQMEANLDFLKDSLNQEAILYGQKMATKKSNALLSKVTDLHDFIMSNGLSMFFYGLFFLVVFSLEIFFLITKSSTADSLFDKMLYAEEKMGERRLQSLMTQRDEILRQDGLLGPRAERIRQMSSEHGNIRKIG
jgi:hypothetical protein